MQLDDDRLDQRGDGDRFLNSRGNVTDAELQGSEGGVRTNIPPDFLSVVDTMEIHEQLHMVVVLAPGAEVVGYTGAGKPPKDRCAVGLQAGVATHPEGRTGGERQQVREEITHGIHQVDHRVAVRHGDVHVHAKDQQGTRELLQFFHADGKAVTHSGARPWGTRVEEAGPALSYSDRGRNTSEEVSRAWAP